MERSKRLCDWVSRGAKTNKLGQARHGEQRWAGGGGGGAAAPLVVLTATAAGVAGKVVAVGGVNDGGGGGLEGLGQALRGEQCWAVGGGRGAAVPLVVSLAEPLLCPVGSLVVPSHSQPLVASTVPAVANEPCPSRLAELMLMLATGIIDSHSYMLALQGDLEAHGGSIAFNTGFASARVADGHFEVIAEGEVTLTAARLINAGGLHASKVARAIEGLDPRFVPDTKYAKGNYFSLAKRAPFTRLIYPAPHVHGLGVHLTLDMGGAAKFGPDVEWVDTLDYEVDPRRGESFYAAIRTYWPDLPDGALQPSYSGIRPKICGPDDPAADFRIDGAAFHGIDHLVNLFGIESPGLTSSLAIAERVSAQLL